jgi:hypothetical protein
MQLRESNDRSFDLIFDLLWLTLAVVVAAGFWLDS